MLLGDLSFLPQSHFPSTRARHRLRRLHVEAVLGLHLLESATVGTRSIARIDTRFITILDWKYSLHANALVHGWRGANAVTAGDEVRWDIHMGQSGAFVPVDDWRLEINQLNEDEH